MKNRRICVESLEERTLLAVVAGGIEQGAKVVTPTEAAAWVVNTLEDPTSWDTTDDVVSLREAIVRAQTGDTITFDDGLAGGTITLSGSELEVSCGITIDASAVGGITIDANQQSRVFYVGGGNESVPVEMIGMTITGGYASYESGGGIYNHEGTITLRDCTVSGNTANYHGGGLCNVKGSLTLMDSTVSGNIAYDAESCGGGILNYQGALTMTDSTVSGNTASLGGGGIHSSPYGTLSLTGCTISENLAYKGGGIYNCAMLTLTDSTVFGNTSNYQGGGIYNDGMLKLTNSTVSGNTANYEGGGIWIGYFGSSTATIVGSIVSGNTANLDGGGIHNYGTLTLTDSTVSENTTNSEGGGILNYGTITLRDCTVSGNSTYLGGGICNCATLTLTDSTVSGNIAYYKGGGIWSWGMLTLTGSIVTRNTANYEGGGIFFGETLYLYNSIIAQNTALIPGNDIYDDVYDVGYPHTINAYNTLSSFTNWTNSENCIVYAPSPPLFTDALHGDFTPAENSQAVNKGNNEYVETETDLVGNPRIYGGIVDIGAYEYQGTPSPTPTEQLTVPTITTGNKGIYVSYGANRHQITWTAVENASGYELAYTTDGVNWSSGWVGETSGTVGNLTYGSYVTYRVRALGEGPYIYSEWSESKTFLVCPMDVNGDGDISGADRTILSSAWLTELYDKGFQFQFYADIDGNGDVSNSDRTYLANNWLHEVGDGNLVYPQPLAADLAFAEFESADLAADLDEF